MLKYDCNFIPGTMTLYSAFHTILLLISWHPALPVILVRLLPCNFYTKPVNSIKLYS